ncbi:MAG: outer membrane protein assembly factor BamA [Pseudomonadota bacterium]
MTAKHRSVALAHQARQRRVGLRGLACILAFGWLISLSAHAERFTVTDIRLQGLQRVSAGTVFNILPLKVGDTIDELTVRGLIRVLFKSGFFRDVRIARDEGVLVVSFQERPAIETIEIDGNKAIKTEALLDGLSQQGLREGEIFKQSTLERVSLELERQYVAQGRYGAGIETTVKELPRNRVSIKIDVEEGKTSGIRHINIVGVDDFEMNALLDELELKHPSLLSFYRNDDKYSREKLQGDIERLESFYRDRGYVEFRVLSTQVSVTPDKRQVYLTINVNEGEKYDVAGVNLIGELNELEPEALERLLLVEEGQVFSQARVTASEERLTGALGNAGYTFATASGVPRINEDDGTVDVEFFVDAGKRAYVRRISFSGNRVTQDEVMRREMRQMEGGWASTSLIDLSKVRLERLGYFKGVNVTTPEVPGTDDQIDVDFTVEEQPSGSVSATFGFAQASGLIIGGNYQQNNVLGTGNSLNFGVSLNRFQESANFSYFNPYFTMDGISRGFNVFYRRLDFDERNIARFITDSLGAGVNFSFPIGETRRINLGMVVEQTDITEGRFPAQEISEFIDKNGSKALNYKTNLSWNASTLNRGLFPTRGRSQAVAMEIALPGSDLEFFKLTYNAQMFLPITRSLTLRLRTEIGYGDGYGDTEALPFYEHFFAGGFGSIRGFEVSTLGPRTTNPTEDADGNEIPPGFFRPRGDPFGGNFLFEGSAELIFPVPFMKDSRQVRPAFFVDVGNVFNTDCPDVSTNCFDFGTDELRYAAGLGVTWLTGLGPMTFAIAKPFNVKDFDDEETFQFELGRTF